MAPDPRYAAVADHPLRDVPLHVLEAARTEMKEAAVWKDIDASHAEPLADAICMALLERGCLTWEGQETLTKILVAEIVADEVEPRPKYVMCREAKPGEQEGEITCIRPPGHDGKHRGVRSVPKAVWWGACSEFIEGAFDRRCAQCTYLQEEHKET